MAETRAQLFAMEKETIAPIPVGQRHGRPRELVAIWFGMNMTPLTVVTGATATTLLGLPLGWSVLAILIGHGVGGIGMALHAAQGPRMGVPQMLQARGQFGSYGAAIIVLIATVMFIGYFSSNLVVASDSLTAVLPGASGNLMLILCTLFSLVVSVFGYTLVRAVTAWSSYVVGALVLISFIALAVGGDITQYLGKGEFSLTGFFAMVAIGVVWQLTYAPYVSDYSRYMPRDTGTRGAFWGSYTGCVLSSILLMVLGAVVGLAVDNADTMAGLGGLLGPVLAAIVLFGFALAASAGNSVNVYCSCLCLLTLIETFRRGWRPMMRARLIATLALHVVGLTIAFAAATSFASSYFNFLSILLYLLIPWSAVNLVDYYLIRRADYAIDDFFAPDGGRYGRWNPGAMIVFVVGVLVQVPFMSTTIFVGPVAAAMDGLDIAWLVGFAVSAGLYILLARVWPRLVRIAPSAPDPLLEAGQG
ncbi:cytosine permease [Saxibacter everestensis]|uniref:Cytosine permease n=1 Tax=Saxibacter everestensis TaxID=2909229 RepID=A0ABY8QPY1_9MICO|nr:cytosine permease [Brevibacteriaceae bacterium ZFBP1038]